MRQQVADGRQENRESRRAAVAVFDANVVKRAAAHLNELALGEVSQGVLICDENRRIISANASFSRMTGFSESELLGQSCAILQGAGSDPATILRMRAALDAEETFEGEILNYRKDGTPFWNELSIAPIRGEFSGPVRFIGIQRDVTERKRAAAETWMLAERLTTTLESITDGFFTLDREWNFTYVNRELERMLQHTRATLLGRNIWELFPEARGTITEREYTRAMETMTSVHFERYYAPLGIHFDVRAFPSTLGLAVSLRDVTEQKKAEADQEESKERFVGAFEHAPSGVALVTLEGRWLKVNRALCELVGYSEEELLMRNIQDITHPDDKAADVEQVSRMVSGEIRSYQIEKRYIHRLGHLLTVLLNVSMVVDGDGAPRYFVAHIQDFTSRREAEQQVRFNEQRYRSLVEATTAIGWETPATGEFATEQPRWKAFTGQTFEEMRGWGWLDAIHPDDRAETLRLWQSAVAHRTVYEVEHRLRTADGHYRDMVGRAVPIQAKDGAILQWFGVHTDITDSKRGQKELSQALDRVRIAVKAGRAGTWEFDLRTGEVDWDEQMYALYGTSSGTVQPGLDRWFDAIHPDDIVATKTTQETSMHDGTDAIDTEFRIHRYDDQRLRFIRAMGAVLRDEEGQPIRMTGINWDVTDERMREQDLARALAVEKELRRGAQAGIHAKSEFLAVMSHEIRTPMNGILGFSELLAGTADLPEDCRDYVKTITSTGEALLRIIDDILDFSRLEAGGLKIEMSLASTREVLTDIQSLLAPLAISKGVDLLIAVDERVPDRLWNDAGRLRQVLLNLAGNALKFTAQGVVTIGARMGAPCGRGCDPSLEFYVRDTGEGIPKEEREHIFEAFTQADSSISRKYGGTGLGLSISRHLVELMGGTLTLLSKVGEGSEFRVNLSLAIPDGAAAEVKEAVTEVLDGNFATRHPIRILLVEDDPVNIKLMLLMLRKLGYDPLLARDGAEAVAMSAGEHPECILMDLQMPRMGGLQATVEIRRTEDETPDLQRAFITALTANVAEDSRLQCFEVSMDGYLNKPIKYALLADTLRCASERRGVPAPKLSAPPSATTAEPWRRAR